MCDKCCSKHYQEREVEEMYSEADKQKEYYEPKVGILERCLVYTGLLAFSLVVWAGIAYLIYQAVKI